MRNADLGQSVSVLFYLEGRPVALRGTVTSLHPFVLATEDSKADAFTSAMRAVLISQKGNEFAKAEAEFTGTQSGEGWNLTANSFGWETVDRRRYHRFDIKAPATVRAVMETGNVAELTYLECFTEDISVGGAWLKSDLKMQGGLLVEFQSELNGKPLRILSVVRWADNGEKDGFGVEFLDFVGGSRQTLHRELAKAA